MLRAENEELRRRLDGADEEYGTLFGVLEKKLRNQVSEDMAEMQATVDNERGRAIAFMTSSTLFEQQVRELKEETKARMQSMQRVILQMADKLDVSHIDYEKDFTKYYTQSLDDFFDSIIGSADTTGVGGEKQHMGQYPTFIGHESTIVPETFDKSRSLPVHHPNDTFARGVAGELLAGIAGEPIGNSNVDSLLCSPNPRCRSTAYADDSVWESVAEADPEYVARPNPLMIPPVPETWGLPPGLNRQVVDTEKVEETKKKTKTVKKTAPKGRQPNASPRVKEWQGGGESPRRLEGGSGSGSSLDLLLSDGQGIECSSLLWCTTYRRRYAEFVEESPKNGGQRD